MEEVLGMRRYEIFITGFMIVIILSLILGLNSWSLLSEYIKRAISLVDKSTPTLPFIAVMLSLPVAGFPVSVILMIAGIKFSLFRAIMLWALIVPIHTIIGYYLANALRNTLLHILTVKLGYRIPKIPEKHEAFFSFIFLAVPGIPYAGKNYLLPLAGVKFRYCVLMNAIIQVLLAIPFIMLGKSAVEMNLIFLLIAAGFLATGAAGIWWLKKRYAERVL